MLFRINFMAIVILVVTDNEYMLYYICVMHTYWFLSVFLFMRVFASWNNHRLKMLLKFFAYFAVNAFIFEIPCVSVEVFRPLIAVLQFHDSHTDLLHEWEFRSHLDHWACFVGMLCAYNYPYFETLISYFERTESYAEMLKKMCIKTVIVIATLALGTVWYTYFMGQNKFVYNKHHCYSSLVPILVYVFLRNVLSVLRRNHINLFSYIGKMTLETYLSQFHVYLQSNAKYLIGYVPGYRLVNFTLATIIYLCISKTLFNITVCLNVHFIKKEWKKAIKVCAKAGLLLIIATVISWQIKKVY